MVKKIAVLCLMVLIMITVPVFATEDDDIGSGSNNSGGDTNSGSNGNMGSQQPGTPGPQGPPGPPGPPGQPPPPTQNPNIRLVSPQSVLLTPGEVQYIDIVVRNIGNAAAGNSLAAASVDGPFSIEFINNDNVLGNVAQNVNRTIRARVTADASAEAGVYAINLEFAFRSTRDGNNETSSDTISVRIDAQARTPQVMLRYFTASPYQVLPGSSFVISAQLLNLGEGNAYNVHVAVAEGLDADGIFLSGSPNAPFLQTVGPNHNSHVSFTLTASERITGGAFPIVFEVIGRNHAGEAISEQFTYFVTVTAPAGGANRAFVSLSVSPPGGVTGVNDHAHVAVTITNNGSMAARNIRISATPADMASIVPASASVQTIGVLEPGASQPLSFVFAPTYEAGSHYHMVGLEVTYDTGITDETDTFEQFVGINVHNPDNQNQGSRPRVLVSAYTVEPSIVAAGEMFDLYLTFQNTNSTRSVYNIRVTLDAVEYEENSGAVFTTVGTSNTIFVESLAPREERSHSFRMFTVPGADPRTYNIDVTFDYEDADFERFDETTRLGISVRQVSRLEIQGVNIPPFATAFQPVFVDFNIINSGRVPLGNLRIEMEGPFDVSGMEIFVGNMGRGNQAAYTGHFTPEMPGEHRGILIVSGEDEVGGLVYVRHEFTVFVEDMDAWDDWNDDMMMGDWDYMTDMDGEDSTLPWLWIIAGGVVVVGAGTAAAIIIVRKKRSSSNVFESLQ